MPNLTFTKAEPVAIKGYPIGSDANMLVVMTPAEDTTGWSVSCVFSLTEGGASVLTLTTGAGQITVGGGTDKNEIEIDLVHADTAAFTGATLYFVVSRTDSGQHDRLSYGTFKPNKPAV